MHPLFPRAEVLTEHLIAAAIEVHRGLGPGLIESLYEWALVCELSLRGIKTAQQRQVRVKYKHFERDEALRFDLLADDCVLIEAKSVAEILPVHKAQLLSYMKLLNVPVGLVVNFNAGRLTAGVARMLLPGANRSFSG